MLNESFLQNIITCPKYCIKADRQEMKEENRHIKNNLYLLSNDNTYKYTMFIRQSLEFYEDFSIGLVWTNPNEYINIKKKIIMLRCQGPHDGKSNKNSDIHHSFHTHEITIDDIENKRYSKPSNRNKADQYNSFEQAILFFISKCKIRNISNFTRLPIDENQVSMNL